MEVNCPYITYANIAVKGDGFALYGVKFVKEPYGNQTLLVEVQKTGDLTYTTVTKNLKVDKYGNLLESPLVIKTDGGSELFWTVRIKNQCGSLYYYQSFQSPQTVKSYDCIFNYAVYNICGTEPITVYSDGNFDVGTILYEDAGLLFPVTGQYFVSLANSGQIYSIDNTTGEILATTGLSCVNTSFEVLLDNNSTTICAASITTVYSNTANLSVGDIIYTDASLQTAVTGYTYLVIVGSPVKYNLDNATGEILSIQGTMCGSYVGKYKASKIIEDLDLVDDVVYYSSTPFGKGAEMHTNSALSSVVTGMNFIKISNSTEVHDISLTTGVVGCTTKKC